MRIKQSRRKIEVEDATEREILRKQMELLSEASAKGQMDDGLSRYSEMMIEINKELTTKPVCALALGIAGFDLCIHLFVFIKKLRRGQR